MGKAFPIGWLLREQLSFDISGSGVAAVGLRADVRTIPQTPFLASGSPMF